MRKGLKCYPQKETLTLVGSNMAVTIRAPMIHILQIIHTVWDAAATPTPNQAKNQRPNVRHTTILELHLSHHISMAMGAIHPLRLSS
jgi:hypothetical protein